MTNRPVPLFVALTATLLLGRPALADNLTGASRLLCASMHATACSPDGECFSDRPSSWQIPTFIEVDLSEKRLSTTEASTERRTTQIRSLEREEGVLLLQGVQRGRAFSLVLVEETGELSMAVATEGLSVAAFGACTPIPGPR